MCSFLVSMWQLRQCWRYEWWPFTYVISVFAVNRLSAVFTSSGPPTNLVQATSSRFESMVSRRSRNRSRRM